MSFTRFNNSSSFSRFSQPDPLNPYDTTSIDKQIANSEMRIKDAGYSPQNTDKRNWFEKATNLPEGQNFFFDALELLGRPGQAIMNALDKKNTNMSMGEALKRGISGEDKVRGSDLLNNTNLSPLAKTIAGTGLEIALDPLTYVPGGVLAKGVSMPAKLAGKAVGGAYKAAEEAIPSFARFSENVARPAAETVKDGLGYMFNPGYKKTETLTGGTSDVLKNLERDTENSRRFMKENYMNDLVDTSKSAGGVGTGTDVGRLMEKDLAVNGPRQYRELPTDPNVISAAEKLMNSNSALRDFAKEKGIDIPELAGYMTHILTKEEKARRASGRAFKIDVGRFGTGNPNKKILNARKLEGSAEDINQQMGRNFFEPNAYFATGAGQQRLIDYIHAVDFRRKVLSNPDFAIPFEKGMDIGKNVVIDSNNYKFLKDSGDTLEGLGLADKVGGQYVVTKAVKQALDRFQHINTDEGTKAFMKAIGATSNVWKKFALFSPGFHVRNFIGNLWNSYAAGMNPHQLTKYTGEAIGEVTSALRGKESELFNEFRREGLLSSGLTKVEMAPGGDQEKAIEKAVKQMSKTGLAKAADRVKHPFNASRDFGEAADMVNRYALYKWARGKGMDSKQAAEKVREALFDYMDITPFEQKTLKNLFPFYTWSRKNIPFQVKKFIEDPRKFQNINKLRLNAQENVGLDESNLPDYMKENFYMPVSGKDGKGQMMSLNLPLGDLTKLNQPLGIFSDLLTPMIKTPIELGANYNLFRGKPIKKFEGQEKKYKIPFINKDIGGLPIQTAYGLEQATGQIGRGLTALLQKDGNSDVESTVMNPSLGIGSFVKPFDADKYAYQQRVDDLRKLQDLILYIQQQEGMKPRTVNQIKKNIGR